MNAGCCTKRFLFFPHNFQIEFSISNHCAQSIGCSPRTTFMNMITKHTPLPIFCQTKNSISRKIRPCVYVLYVVLCTLYSRQYYTHSVQYISCGERCLQLYQASFFRSFSETTTNKTKKLPVYEAAQKKLVADFLLTRQ